MNGLALLIPLALLMGGVGLVGFFWSLRSGQYDDLEGPAYRLLMDDRDEGPAAPESERKAQGAEGQDRPRND